MPFSGKTDTDYADLSCNMMTLSWENDRSILSTRSANTLLISVQDNTRHMQNMGWWNKWSHHAIHTLLQKMVTKYAVQLQWLYYHLRAWVWLYASRLLCSLNIRHSHTHTSELNLNFEGGGASNFSHPHGCMLDLSGVELGGDL